MAEKRKLTQQEIDAQTIHARGNWNVLFPERPVGPYHFMLVINRPEAEFFTSLEDEELSDMKRIIAELVAKLGSASEDELAGYNLFSNNGEASIGQHIDRFHQHIFIRFANEPESPYTVMGEGRRWNDSTTEEWLEHYTYLRNTLAK